MAFEDENASEPCCPWSRDTQWETIDTFDSSCGNKWTFYEGGPEENKMKFCPYCGKKLTVIATD